MGRSRGVVDQLLDDIKAIESMMLNRSQTLTSADREKISRTYQTQIQQAAATLRTLGHNASVQIEEIVLVEQLAQIGKELDEKRKLVAGYKKKGLPKLVANTEKEMRNIEAVFVKTMQSIRALAHKDIQHDVANDVQKELLTANSTTARMVITKRWERIAAASGKLGDEQTANAIQGGLKNAEPHLTAAAMLAEKLKNVSAQAFLRDTSNLSYSRIETLKAFTKALHVTKLAEKRVQFSEVLQTEFKAVGKTIGAGERFSNELAKAVVNDIAQGASPQKWLLTAMFSKDSRDYQTAAAILVGLNNPKISAIINQDMALATLKYNFENQPKSAQQDGIATPAAYQELIARESIDVILNLANICKQTQQQLYLTKPLELQDVLVGIEKEGQSITASHPSIEMETDKDFFKFLEEQADQTSEDLNRSGSVLYVAEDNVSQHGSVVYTQDLPLERTSASEIESIESIVSHSLAIPKDSDVINSDERKQQHAETQRERMQKLKQKIAQKKAETPSTYSNLMKTSVLFDAEVLKEKGLNKVEPTEAVKPSPPQPTTAPSQQAAPEPEQKSYPSPKR
jgi:hypothetical protein